jgi:hypothetical protein
MPMQTRWDLIKVPQKESDNAITGQDLEQLQKLERAATLAASVAEEFRRKLEARKRIEPPVAFVAYWILSQ